MYAGADDGWGLSVGVIIVYMINVLVVAVNVRWISSQCITHDGYTTGSLTISLKVMAMMIVVMMIVSIPTLIVIILTCLSVIAAVVVPLSVAMMMVMLQLIFNDDDDDVYDLVCEPEFIGFDDNGGDRHHVGWECTSY